MKNCLHQIGLGASLWDIFLISDLYNKVQYIMGVATLGRSSWVISESRLSQPRKVSQQTMLSSGLCFNRLPQLPRMMSTACNPNTPFLPIVSFDQCSITAIGRHARANLTTAATTPSGSHCFNLSVCVTPRKHEYPWRPEEGVRCPGPGVA